MLTKYLIITPNKQNLWNKCLFSRPSVGTVHSGKHVVLKYNQVHDLLYIRQQPDLRLVYYNYHMLHGSTCTKPALNEVGFSYWRCT